MKAGQGGEVSGVLLVDKSAGPTSHDVVVRVRRVLRTRRIGHTGTLDPFATGLLILCIGRATRLSEYFHIPEKRYEAELKLGVETTSHDSEGTITTRSEAWRSLQEDDVRRVLDRFEGPIEQLPPALSAKKVGGRRAHELTRTGAEVRLSPTSVMVHGLQMLLFEPPTLRLAASVSTGTYIRALARDIGRALGCGAHLTALRRTAIGDLSAEDGFPGDLLEEEGLGADRIYASGAWLEAGAALSWLPARDLSDEELALIGAGRVIPSAPTTAVATASSESGPEARTRPYRLLHDGRLVAIAEHRNGALQPRKVLVG